jgi:hypothetical protein
MDDDRSQPRLGKHGGPRTKGQRSNGVTQRGNSRTYIIERLSRDGHHTLTAMVREGRMSAYAAARKAGFGGPPRTHRLPTDPPKPSIDDFVKTLIG